MKCSYSPLQMAQRNAQAQQGRVGELSDERFRGRALSLRNSGPAGLAEPVKGRRGGGWFHGPVDAVPERWYVHFHRYAH